MILIVDDNVVIRQALQQILQHHGYDALSCSDGTAALDFLQYETPDLLILDFNMPGLSGHDVLRAMRADSRWQDIPVLIYTAETSEQTRVESLRLGAQAYLLKGPLAWEHLQFEVQRLAGAPI